MSLAEFARPGKGHEGQNECDHETQCQAAKRREHCDLEGMDERVLEQPRAHNV